MDLTKLRNGEYHEPIGALKLFVDDDVVGEPPEFAFTGGRIVKVVYDGNDAYVDLEAEMAAALSRD